MESIKLSQLNPETYMIHGKRNELGTVSLLLRRLYESKKLPSNPRVLINNHNNYKIDIDIKKEDIICGFKCWVCDKYLGKDQNVECDKHPYSQNENYAPECVYIIERKKDV